MKKPFLNSTLLPSGFPVIAIEHADLESGTGNRIRVEIEPRPTGVVMLIKHLVTGQKLGEVFVENSKQSDEVGQVRLYTWSQNEQEPTATLILQER